MKKPKEVFVELTIKVKYLGVGETLEQAKDNAFENFLQHQANPNFSYEVSPTYKKKNRKDIIL
jgi:hypothetical protein